MALKVRQRRVVEGNDDSTTSLPLMQQDGFKQDSTVHHNKRNKSATASYFVRCGCSARAFGVSLALGLVLTAALHEAFYYAMLYHTNVAAGFLPSSSSSYRHQSASVSLATAQIAVVSLHSGFKFAGILGRWLVHNKAAYAQRHGYAYVDHFGNIPDAQLAHLDAWQQERRVYFDKLRYLLYLCRRYDTNLEYLLWLDGDAVVTNPDVGVLQDRVPLFDEMFAASTAGQQQQQPWCFVWARDALSPNAGVLLLRNSVALQTFLETAIRTYDINDPFLEQTSLRITLDKNCTPLLLSVSDSRFLQSRTRGLQSLIYQPGDWILHLPNHNRWELVWDLHAVSNKRNDEK